MLPDANLRERLLAEVRTCRLPGPTYTGRASCPPGGAVERPPSHGMDSMNAHERRWMAVGP
jgi:hypothetical protein